MKISFHSNSKNYQRIILPVLIFLIIGGTIFYNLLYYKFIRIDPDEGVLIADAEKILDEPFPYLKFNLHMPGRYYLLALFYKLFGRSVATERIMFIFIHCLNNILLFFLSRKLLPDFLSLFPSLLLLLVPGYWFKAFFALFILLNLMSIFFYLENPSKKILFLSGVIVGISFWFRIDCAGYAGLAFFIVIALRTLRLKLPFKEMISNFLILSGPIIMIIACLFFIYLLKDELYIPLKIIINDIKVAQLQSPSLPGPGEMFKGPFRLKGKCASLFFVYSSFLALFLAAIMSIKELLKTRSELINWHLIASFLLAGLSFTHIWKWTSIFRLPQSGALIHLLWFYLIYICLKQRPRRIIIRQPLIIVFLIFALLVQIYFVYFSFYGPPKVIQDASSLPQRFGDHLPLKSPKGKVSPPSRQAFALNRLCTLIERRTKPTDTIFCFGESVLYFLANRRNATDFTNMMNMIVDDELKAKLTQQLILNSPKIIICRNFEYNYFYPYLKDVFELISGRYRPLKNVANYKVYIIK